MKKGQFALEFVILISFTLIFSAVLLVIIQKSYAESQQNQHEDQVNQIMRIVFAEVNMAELSPAGYQRNFTLPRLINGQEYVLFSKDDSDLVFQYNGHQYVFFLPNSSLDGACKCLKPGENILRKECPPMSSCVIKMLNTTTMNPCIPCN